MVRRWLNRIHLCSRQLNFFMRRLPSFFALRAFEAAARLGGFTQAGEELHLTPSAISHQVRALETWFGRALFTRGVRKVTLTIDGQRLLDRLIR